MLVLLGLGAPVADIVLKVSFSDEFLNLILEANAFFHRVADISVVSTILVLVPLPCIESGCLYTPVCSVAKNTSSRDLVRSVKLLHLLRRGSRDLLIRALGLLLVAFQRSPVISTLALLAVPNLLSGHGLSRVQPHAALLPELIS